MTAKTEATNSSETASTPWWSRVEPHERSAVGWATAWFFCILLAYLIVRPVRETMGSIGGTRQLQGLMLATFLVMLAAVPLYSSLVARLPRRWLVRVVYHFFAVCLVTFFLLMQLEAEFVRTWTARAFFVWVNVFALFATSVFWSVLADLFSSNQGKRLFGMIAAGGTAGAITGSLLTSQLATQLSTGVLLLLPAVVIEAGLWCAWRLEKQSTVVPDAGEPTPRPTESPTGGGLLSGITHVVRSPYLAMICLFLVLVQSCGTQLYFQQAEIVASEIETKEARTQLFAYLDLGTQLLTLAIQALLSGVILKRLGVSVALVVLPIIYFAGFASLAMSPVLPTLVVTMIATRAGAYGITVPAREVLFTVVSREDKYKSKSFIDTVVLRGGDAMSGQLFGFARQLGVSITTMNVWALPVTVAWGLVAWKLGRLQKRRAAELAAVSEMEA
ncbi:NTP/NDP exchange transporter [Aporhodopirellula aestuarii]|uniref:MFS transporter n=1 Tax=Aporhodopirellula aestuarii TaxID=2950107 RepID=A0ABT0U9A6_9BACT|nr:MFS transporter [Aporhodopirellula aestuarii]MCM2373356.1 MFS transporter [Aporhodopirellula aestuarii]